MCPLHLRKNFIANKKEEVQVLYQHACAWYKGKHPQLACQRSSDHTMNQATKWRGCSPNVSKAVLRSNVKLGVWKSHILKQRIVQHEIHVATYMYTVHIHIRMISLRTLILIIRSPTRGNKSSSCILKEIKDSKTRGENGLGTCHSTWNFLHDNWGLHNQCSTYCKSLHGSLRVFPRIKGKVTGVA